MDTLRGLAETADLIHATRPDVVLTAYTDEPQSTITLVDQATGDVLATIYFTRGQPAYRVQMTA